MNGNTDSVRDAGRRRFIRTAPALSGLVLVAGLPGVLKAEEPKKYGADGMPNGWQDSPKTFLSIAPDGTVTIVAHRAEMGQGIRTSLPMVVADELEADWSRVRVVQAPGNEEKFGNQDTDGSRSMRHWYQPMRCCGASARMMLEQAAADRWKVPVSEVRAVNHQVVHQPSGRKLGYGELAMAAAALDVPARDTVRFKKPEEFRYIGKKHVHSIDGRDVVSGKAVYGIDVKQPGLLHAVIARPPVLGAKVLRFDPAAAMKVPGVLRVVEVPGAPPPSEFQPVGGVAVVARDTWAAMKGREALKIEWDASPHQAYDSGAYRKELEAAVRKPGGKEIRSQGDVYAALEKAPRRMSADYYVPHLAHAPMEPPASTAKIANGKCEVWAACQSPQAARDRIAKHLGLQPQDVTVNVTLLGGGFGRKSKADFVVESALLSKAMDGAPVKVTWTREDDLHNDYLHAASAQHLEAAIGPDGRIQAWLHRTAEPTFMSLFMPDPRQLSGIEVGLGLVNLPFDVPNIRIENQEAEAHARIGWLRSVNNIQHAFAAQSFVAEIAAATGRDPRDVLLQLLGPDRLIDPRDIKDGFNHGESPERYPLDTARLRKVIERATKEAGWGRAMPAGTGLGLGAHYSFVTYVAAVVEAHVNAKGEVVIPRVDVAVDCGPVVNADRVRSQMEGAVINGIGQAMLSEISFASGRVQQDNFHQFELLRMNAAPRRINVHILPSAHDVPLGGVGEPGVPPIAPALCNAIFQATGKRIRELPIREQLRSA